ncbi:PP28 domain-containing protein [Caerostris extrusa]|uniref:PP28 domain-containing protein n=1 Tax=Caerostris extrusa TaxID=172846 RepID=A0AAV4XJJ6_CAEEX|nr:PP28 domain-containing protein [Caerostris extrusa]
MPPKGRGRGYNHHKGSRRHFTNPDQLAESEEKKEKERQWRQQRGEISSDEESEESKSSSESEEESEEGSGDEKQLLNAIVKQKAKGVQHLIEVENPNHVVKKEKKVGTINLEETAQSQLSRREREELEKQRAKAHYQKMHAAGRTNEAKADLARLAIIKKQREEAAKRREQEIKAKQEADQAKANQTKKALGKRT